MKKRILSMISEELETNATPNSLDNKIESSPMEADDKEDHSWDLLQFLGTKSVSHSNASLIHGQESLNNTVIDHKNKGVYIPPCFLTPIHSHKLSTSRSIYEKGEPSTRFCVICKDPKPDLQQSRYCKHHYCLDCLKPYLIKEFKEAGLPINCLLKGCNEDLPDDFLNFLPQEMLDRGYDCELEAKALAYQDYIVCPFDDCGSRFLDDMKNYVIRACPKCWKIFCMRCGSQWHMGIRCPHDFGR